MAKTKWQGLIAQLHESIKADEGDRNPDIPNYVSDDVKTPAMRRWEKRFNERIDVGIRTSPIICNYYPRLCTRIPSARCFYHRYGQIDARLALAWKRILGMADMNLKCLKLWHYFKDKKREMERMNVHRVPLVLTEKEVLVIIQALALVPEDLEIE